MKIKRRLKSLKRNKVISVVFLILAVLFFGFCVAAPFLGRAVGGVMAKAEENPIQLQSEEDIPIVYLPTNISASNPRTFGYTRRAYKPIGFDITTTALEVGLQFPTRYWGETSYISSTDEISRIRYEISFVLKNPVPKGGVYYRFGGTFFGNDSDNLMMWQGFLPAGQQYVSTTYDFVIPYGVNALVSDFSTVTRFIFFQGEAGVTDTFLIGTQFSVYYAALTFETSSVSAPKKEKLVIIDELDIFNALKSADTQYQTGFEDGHFAGYNEGYQNGKAEGETLGYNNGYDKGYTVGKSDGYNLGISENINPIVLFLQPAQDFMNMKIFGSFSLADAFGIVLTVLMATIFIKLFAGG